MIYELLLIRLNVLKMVRRVSYEDEIKTQVFKLQLMIINLILKLKWIYQSLIHLVKQFSFLSCPFQLCVCQPVKMLLPCLSFFFICNIHPLSPPPLRMTSLYVSFLRYTLQTFYEICSYYWKDDLFSCMSPQWIQWTAIPPAQKLFSRYRRNNFNIYHIISSCKIFVSVKILITT